MDIQQTLTKYLHTGQRSVLTLHRTPDGDSIGSNLAVYHVLRSFGHTVNIFSIDAIPQYSRFLPGVNEITVRRPRDISWKNYDLYWALDMGSPTMIGETIEFPPHLHKIVIDHHITNAHWGDTNLVQADLISCTSVLFRLFKQAGVKITPEIATCLLTGLMTDSGFLAYSKDSLPFRDAADLVDLGGAYEQIKLNIHNDLYLEDMHFIGKVLERMEVIEDKRMVLLSIPYDLWIYHVGDEDKTYLVQRYLAMIHDTDYGVLITEKEQNKFRVSFRSRAKGVDVSKLALQLGGGGHKEAAGASIEGKTLEEAITIIKNLKVE